MKANSSKSWELRFKRPDGRCSWLGLGGFPNRAGKAARKEAFDLSAMAANGVDIVTTARSRSCLQTISDVMPRKRVNRALKTRFCVKIQSRA
ncbi:Arm DNA-binding domain-containing protein [Kushneria indalinina]|uniref:Arm DNA-binding domain-containing protein n=1 Tax=Kushneria indalinina TaxID=184067 RepID=UPI001B8775DF